MKAIKRWLSLNKNCLLHLKISKAVQLNVTAIYYFTLKFDLQGQFHFNRVISINSAHHNTPSKKRSPPKWYFWGRSNVCAPVFICIVSWLWSFEFNQDQKEGGRRLTKAFWFSIFWAKSLCVYAREQTKHTERLQERAVEQSVGQGSRADCIPRRISGARIATPRIARNFVPSTTREEFLFHPDIASPRKLETNIYSVWTL